MDRERAEITTERLVLRDWRDSDRPRFADLNSDPVVMEHFPAPLTRRESDLFVDRITADLGERGWGLWAVEVIDPGERAPFIGYVGLAPVGFDAHFGPAVEIGWRLARRHWGRGYATEAAMGVIDWAREHLEVDEIVSFTAQTNERSRAVMRRLGMTHDPADDFDHPLLEPGSRLRRHVLHRLRLDD